ncbi:probable Modin [Phialocephala subalpina]|uniref:Probable Modin n=1 Tax=Phialocephala subalpina TaxID=576137 RepID=A0A1L7X741_9HELO|nr:probable Modin [Phialocephala subalpina]
MSTTDPSSTIPSSTTSSTSSSSATSSGSGGGNGIDNVNQNVFGVVALIVSVVALFTTVLQVLQQYFSSADGHRRCHKSVIGLWAKGTKRKLRFNQFRIEVVFETPVIFAAPPDNDRGPVPERKIHYIVGTSQSYKDTRVLEPDAQKQADAVTIKQVHTADDERASWLTLISTLQESEHESREWDRQKRLRPKAPWKKGPPVEPDYQLAAALQSKTRSWDFIPSSITKPYATSAMCHLVELMAMLGLYWKTFDQSTWNLRAEGNGFILTSTHVHGLGVMVVFATTGRSEFKENRVIPSHAISQLTFGTVPNIFDDVKYQEQAVENQSLDLVFGSARDEADTLESLGCQPATLNRWQKDHKHIFSLSFEIIGMLGKVIRIRGSSFKMIPNPTNDQWSKKVGKKASWKVARLMEVFQSKLQDIITNDSLPNDHRLFQIRSQWLEIEDLDWTDELDLSLEAREAIHDALDEQTKFLLTLRQLDILSVLVAHITKVVGILVNPQSPLNTIVLLNKEDALFDYYFSKIRPDVIGNKDLKGTAVPVATEKEKGERDVIWISLMYRMLCWFMLHDFDGKDVKIVPSDLKGSRMPIYIG